MYFLLTTFLVGISLTSALPQSPTSTLPATPTITLDYATVVPYAGNSSLGYYKYQNIPFAAAPTGSSRWKKPRWPNATTTIVDGTLVAQDVSCSADEDCLYMDVWAPADAVGRNLPVMVWTYGGGFTGGSKAENTPEGLFELSKDFIFVSFNYRLGISGLANGPTFLHEGGTSNLALWDVQHAYQWVHKYIPSFGGNTSDITAFGFSAGASQILFQITRFAGHAEQLFKQAYITSPGYVPGAGHHTAEQFWQNVSTVVGCPSGHLECMKLVNFTTLNDAATNVTSEYTYQFQPRVDGDFVPDTYEANLYQGRFNFSGPLVITHEQHEANSQAYTGVNTTDDVSEYLRIFFPAITDDVIETLLELYPENDYASPGLRFADMKQSFDLTAHNLALTEALGNDTWNGVVALGAATHGTDQSYYWYSDYTLLPKASMSAGNGGPPGTSTGAGTSSFSSNGTSTTNSTSSTSGTGMGGSSSSRVNTTTASIMQKYLMSFVLTGNPNKMWSNDTGKIYWPKHDEGAFDVGTQLVINETMALGEDDLAATSNARFWNQAVWY